MLGDLILEDDMHLIINGFSASYDEHKYAS